MSKTSFILGDWNAICQRCGFQYMASQLTVEWTGLRVCQNCWESRHPQDLLPAPRIEKALPWTSPELTEVEDSDAAYNDIIHVCSPFGIYAQADFAEADCATVDLINGGLVI